MTPNAAFLKTLAGLLVSTLAVGILLFGAAGRLDWALGWLFLAAWSLLKLVFLIILRWRDPALMVERATRHKNTQRYDRLILPVYFVLAFGTILLGGLDGGRYHWSGNVPLVVIILSYVIYLFGNGLAAWSVNSNPFFSSESRIQADRGQKVTSAGPYLYVRHPAYLAAILLWLVTGPMLASWWAVIPGVLAAFTMFLRTVYEDRMLQKELGGYADYAQKVRYRLFPGLW